jgi:transposase
MILHATGVARLKINLSIHAHGVGQSMCTFPHRIFGRFQYFLLIIKYRGLKYGDEGDALIQAALYQRVQQQPRSTVAGYVADFHAFGVPLRPNFIKRIFSSWGWTWKKPAIQQLLKYTPHNIRYYAEWVTLIAHIPFSRLKFCDEAHFVPRTLQRQRAVGPRGVRRYLTDRGRLGDSFSLTMLLDPANTANPFFFEIRAESNSEEDFLQFVTAAVRAGRLQHGDFFVVDNASIHFGQATRARLELLFARHGITYLFLPTYSPELNPCELVFAFIKTFIRNERQEEGQVVHLIVQSLIELPFESILNFYRRCVLIHERVPSI